MTLGENITRLRAARGLSQGTLAEALDVSRQSVSKWETDASVPELDKLMKLAGLFGVTLDELVTGEAPAAASAPEPEPRVIVVERERPRETRKTVGAVLLGGAFLVVLLFALLWGDPWVGALPAIPLVLCGIIFLAVRRHPGLVCAWVAGCVMDVYLRLATGVSWRYIFLTPHFTPEMNWMRLFIGWVLFFYMLVLPALTAWRLRHGEANWTKKHLVFGWAVFTAVWLAAHFGSRMIPLWYYGWTDWLLLGAFTALVTFTVRVRRKKES